MNKRDEELLDMIKQAMIEQVMEEDKNNSRYGGLNFKIPKNRLTGDLIEEYNLSSEEKTLKK